MGVHVVDPERVLRRPEMQEVRQLAEVHVKSVLSWLRSLQSELCYSVVTLAQSLEDRKGDCHESNRGGNWADLGHIRKTSVD